MTNSPANDSGSDEQRLADLIRKAGAREQPPAAVSAAVRDVVAAEWRQVVAARARRRAVTLRWSAVAATLVAGVATWLAVPQLQPEPTVVASMARVSGPVQINDGGLFGRWVPARAGAGLSARAEVRSAAGGRAALQFGRTSVRLDEDSVVAMLAPDRIALKRGAVYIDAEQGVGPAAELVVETPLGNVQHLGTQYETRLGDGVLRVRVREGRVVLRHGGQAVEGLAGDQVTLLSSGELRRGSVARADGEWAWVETVAPDFDINDRTLLEFLNWVSRETGRELSFAAPASERAARTMVLRGSVIGMSPRQALAAVLTTTELKSSDSGAVLWLDFKTGDR